MSKTVTKTQLLVEGALMIALATILSYIKLFSLPYGGAITLEMIPLVLMAYRNGTKWGVFTAFVHSVLQLIIGFSNVMYCPTLLTQIGCILLDYILAFSVLGLAKFFADLFGEKKVLGVALGAAIVCLIRFACSFLSGVLIWGEYMPDTFTNVWWYSFVYNGSYMIPNAIITAVIAAVLYKAVPKFFHAK